MTKRPKTYEGPLSLDMDFDEALARFAKTDPKELSRRLDRERVEKGAGMPELVWSKKLSTTDAQQPTSGGIVPYLRLTKGSLKGENFQTWFRDTFFAGASWAPGEFGRETDIEIAKVVISVVVNGVKLGDKPFTVTHGPNRQDKHETPNTWLHWPPAVQEIIM